MIDITEQRVNIEKRELRLSRKEGRVFTNSQPSIGATKAVDDALIEMKQIICLRSP